MRQDGAPRLSRAAGGVEDKRGRLAVRAVPHGLFATGELVDDQRGSEMRQHPVSLVAGKEWVERDRGCAELERSPERGDEAPAVREEKGDGVAGADSAAREPARRAARAQFELAPRQRAAVPHEGRSKAAAARCRIE